MTAICADAHVHIHDCFDLDRLFAAALDRALELAAPLILLLSESDGDDYFERLSRLAARESDGVARESPSSPPAAHWRIRETSEAQSLLVERNRGPHAEVHLVAGRQKVSTEAVEVLALGLDPADPLRREADGTLSTETLVRLALDAGALAVLPWGFGKWIGSRGARVADLVRREDLCGHPRFFLGDIAHRCWPWPTPAPFRAAVRVLPGTDPLPLSGLEDGLARYGFRVEGGWNRERPLSSLLEALAGGSRVDEIGRRDPWWTAFHQQLRYRMRRE